MTIPTAPPADSPARPTLRRSLSLPLITLYGLGTIVGAGIYVLIGEVAGMAGMYAPVAFLLAAAVASLTAFSYAELAARFPRSAAEAVYLREAFGANRLAGVTGWAVVLVGVISSATIANGFVGYLALFLPAPDWLAISVLVLALGLLAGWGISESVWAAAIVTVIEIGGLLLVLALTGGVLGDLPQRWQDLLPPLRAEVWAGIAPGALLAFFAFIGFEDMVNVAEEVKNPRRNLPLAIVLALLLATLLYVAVALIAVLALPPAQLAGEGAPLARLLENAGHSTTGIGLISMVAVVNGALIQIIMGSRMIYGMALQGNAPAAFAAIHPRTRTPLPATALAAALVLVMALWLPIVTLAQLTSYITLVIFTLINAALWRIKRRPDAGRHAAPSGDRDGTAAPPGGGARPIRCPLWVPIAGTLLCAGFALLQLALQLNS